MHTISFRLPRYLHEKLESLSQERGCNMSGVMREALQKYFSHFFKPRRALRDVKRRLRALRQNTRSRRVTLELTASVSVSPEMFRKLSKEGRKLQCSEHQAARLILLWYLEKYKNIKNN